MKRHRLAMNGLMRLAACAMMVVFGMGYAWGGAPVAPTKLSVNSAFLKWYKALKKADSNEVKSINKKGQLRLVAANNQQVNFGMGLVPDLYDMSYLANLNVSVVQSVGSSYPEKYDLREKELVTPVKNQNPYGTCWAHATFGSMESFLKMSTGKEYDFSENNLVNLNGWDYSGWYGGNPSASSGYLLRWDGPVLESQDKYYNPHKSVKMAPAFHVQQIRWIPSKTNPTDNNAIKKLVTEHGGVFVTYYHEDDFLSSHKGYYYNGISNDNHAVTIVGWDDKYSRDNFKREPAGDGAYIVKNSWGPNWGDDGYFYVSYYDSKFGNSRMYSFSNAESVENYAKKYEYDPLGFVCPSLWESSTCHQYGANIFEATETEELAAIGFYALGPNTSYEISVYSDVKGGQPTSGKRVHTQSGTLEMAGFYTIPLDKMVSVQYQELFSIVMSIKTPGLTTPLALEIAFRDGVNKGSDYPTSNATSEEGQSFLSFDGKEWWDMYVNAKKYRPNFCCKAYTKSSTPIARKLSSISIKLPDNHQSASLKPKDEFQLSCMATYNNNSTENVTEKAQWSMIEGRNYASIDSKGYFKVKDMEIEEAQIVRVQAIYTENKVVVSNNFGFSLAAKAPNSPTGIKATEGTESTCVRITWNAAKGATEYAVYRANENKNVSAGHLGNVTDLKFSDNTAVPGIDYWYFVKSKNTSGSNMDNVGIKGWRKLSPPDSVTASDNLADKIEVKWNESAGAKAYRVYRSDTIEGEGKPISGWQTGTTYQDTTAGAGKTYYYYVASAVDTNGTRPSDLSIIEDGKIVSPVKASKLAISGPATIESGKYGEYSAKVEYSDQRSEDVTKKCNWSKSGSSADMSGAGTSKVKLTAMTVTENKAVKLIAFYTENGKTVTCTNDITIVAASLSEPTGLKVTSTTASGVGLSWDTMAGASSYKVYRASGKTAAKAVGETKNGTTSFLDTTVTPGVQYIYSVAAVNSRGESTHNVVVKVTVPPSAPLGVRTASETSGIMVSWQPSSGATHYRVARAESEMGTKTKLGSWQTDMSYLDTSAVAGNTYYYFVRAATSSDGANASAYSETAQVGKWIPEGELLSIAISGPEKVSAEAPALYSCTATYSNKSSPSQVQADWSVSPTTAAVIDGDGRLTAKSVSKDTQVTVTASFTDGVTKKATKKVTILAATMSATAQVKDVTVATRWPFAALLDIDYTLVVSPSGGKAVVSVFGHDEDHGADVAVTTLSGDGADGAPIAAGKHRLTWDIGADYPDYHANAFNLTLTAVPSTTPAAETYAVTYKPGTYGTGSQQKATKKKDVALTLQGEMFVREGYKQTGWAMSDGGSKAYKLSASYTANAAITLYPFWTANTYMVKFNANGGAGAMSDLSMTYGTAKNLPYNSFKKDGSNFAGWSTTSSGSVEYADGATANNMTATQGDVVTLYAKWTEIPTYTVKYLPGSNGTGSQQTATKTKDVALTLKGVIFTRTGYTQTGWAASDGRSKAYDLSASYTANAAITLYPSWTANTYTIKFDPNGGTGTMSDLSMTYDTAKNLPYNSFKKEGSNFAGWSTTTESVEFADGASANNLTVTQGDVVTLYAKWTEIPTYTVKYLPGFNGTGSQQTATKTKDVALTLKNAIFARTGYEQTGWATSDGGSKAYELSASYTANAAITLYPFWTANTYTIKFNANGGTGTMSDLSMTYDAAKSLPNKGFTKDRNAFTGWATSTDGNVVYANGASVKNLTAAQRGVVTLYAKWTPVWNLMPLRNLLTNIEKLTPDGVLSDDELNKAMANPHYADLDGDSSTISSAEMSIFKRIQALNTDKTLLSKVIEGNYLGITDATMEELQSLADAVKELTTRQNEKVYNLTPVRNLLTGIEALQPDGVLSDDELNKAINNPHYADLDGNANVISSEEMSIYRRIQALNTDKTLLSNVMKGNYSTISDNVLEELDSIGKAILALTLR